MTDFWMRKMKTYFQRIDFDKDGSITNKDFQGMADRVIEKGQLNKEQQEKLRQHLTDIWVKYLSQLGGGESIALDPFIDSMKKLVQDESLKATLEGPLPLFFESVDSNSDGMISAEEFKQFFVTLGLDESLAPESFKAIDDNNDGQISLEEFKHNGSEFFLEQNDESKPSKLFWGPLV